MDSMPLQVGRKLAAAEDRSLNHLWQRLAAPRGVRAQVGRHLSVWRPVWPHRERRVERMREPLTQLIDYSLLGHRCGNDGVNRG